MLAASGLNSLIVRTRARTLMLERVAGRLAESPPEAQERSLFRHQATQRDGPCHQVWPALSPFHVLILHTEVRRLPDDRRMLWREGGGFVVDAGVAARRMRCSPHARRRSACVLCWQPRPSSPATTLWSCVRIRRAPPWTGTTLTCLSQPHATSQTILKLATLLFPLSSPFAVHGPLVYH